MSHTEHHHPVTVTINLKEYEFANRIRPAAPSRSGADIPLADVLFLNRPHEDEVIANDAHITLKNGERFHSAPPANSRQAAHRRGDRRLRAVQSRSSARRLDLPNRPPLPRSRWLHPERGAVAREAPAPLRRPLRICSGFTPPCAPCRAECPRALQSKCCLTPSGSAFPGTCSPARGSRAPAPCATSCGASRARLEKRN